MRKSTLAARSATDALNSRSQAFRQRLARGAAFPSRGRAIICNLFVRHSYAVTELDGSSVGYRGFQRLANRKLRCSAKRVEKRISLTG
jgi:hypothetical protein